MRFARRLGSRLQRGDTDDVARFRELTSRLDTTQLYRVCDRLLSKPDDAEVLTYDPRTMKVHELNESLTFVFGMCDGSNSCEEISIALMKRYGLDVETASKEAYCALKLLANDGLIEPQ